MIFEAAGIGTGEGGGGLRLGPPQNQFSGLSETVAEAARDAYGTANAAWLAQYDAEPSFVIIVSWPATNPTHTTYQARRGGSWADVTPVIRGPVGRDGLSGSFERTLFRSGETMPPTPTAPATVATPDTDPAVPAGWQTFPPDTTDPIWASIQRVARGSTDVTYTGPDRWDGVDGTGGGDTPPAQPGTGEFYGALLKVTGTQDQGLYVTATAGDYTWHLRTEERDLPQELAPASVMFSSSDDAQSLTWSIPQDYVTGPEGANDIRISYVDHPALTDAVAASYAAGDLTIAWHEAGAPGNVNQVVFVPSATTSESVSVTERAVLNMGVTERIDLHIEGYVAGTTTYQDLIDAYSGTNFALSVAAGQGGTALPSAAPWTGATHALAGGMDAGARLLTQARLVEPAGNYVITLYRHEGARNTTLAELAAAIRASIYQADDGRNQPLPTSAVVVEGAGDAVLVQGTLPVRFSGGQSMVVGEDLEASAVDSDANLGPHILLRFHAGEDPVSAIKTVVDAADGLGSQYVGPVTGAELPEAPGINRYFHDIIDGDLLDYLEVETGAGTGGLTQIEVDRRIRALVNALALAGDTDRWGIARLPSDLVTTSALTAAIANFISSAESTSIANARIAALVASWALLSNTDALPDSKIPSGIARDSEVATAISTAIANFLTETQIEELFEDWAQAGNTDALPDSKIPSDIARDAEVTTAINAALTNYRTVTQINTLIDTALANHIQDRGAWAQEQEYAANSLVFHDGDGGQFATYLALAAVAANTQAVTEPGRGSAWRSSWFRVGFSEGPPDAFTGGSASGDTITLTRRSGANPLELTVAGGSSGPSPTAGPYAVYRQFQVDPTIDISGGNGDIADTGDGFILEMIPDTEVAGGLRTDRDFESHFEGLLYVSFAANEGLNILSKFTHIIPARGALPERRFTTTRTLNFIDISAGALLTVPLIELSSRTRLSTGTITVDGTDYTIEEADFAAPSRIQWELEFQTTGRNDNSRRAVGSIDVLRVDRARATFYQLAAFSVGTFAPTELGRAVLDLDGTDTQVGLTNTSGDTGTTARDDPIVCPDAGWIISVITADQNGFDGAVTWALAADLRAERLEAETGLNLYTDETTGQIFLDTGGTPTAETGVEVLIFHLGSTADASGIPTRRVPAILRFDVTGEASPDAGSIANDEYSFDAAISQPGHVAAARIVGFAGTTIMPSSVHVLATLSDYTSESGTVRIPAGVSLAAGETYTIRLEVYETGQTTADQPVAYHDYRITAVAPAMQTLVHFGGTQYSYPDNVPANQDFVDSIDLAADGIATMRQAAGSWTVTGLMGGDTQAIALWIATPTSLDLPTHFSEQGIDQTSSWAGPLTRTIAGTEYSFRWTDLTAPGNAASLNGQTWVIS